MLEFICLNHCYQAFSRGCSTCEVKDIDIVILIAIKVNGNSEASTLLGSLGFGRYFLPCMHAEAVLTV